MHSGHAQRNPGDSCNQSAGFFDSGRRVVGDGFLDGIAMRCQRTFRLAEFQLPDQIQSTFQVFFKVASQGGPSTNPDNDENFVMRIPLRFQEQGLHLFADKRVGIMPLLVPQLLNDVR